ncbi:MAG: VCBS repeat-containing protein [Proteobacteria bacterium]|nr:VCBS repeat-containing protein [Pseudomonadota bacterium]
MLHHKSWLFIAAALLVFSSCSEESSVKTISSGTNETPEQETKPAPEKPSKAKVGEKCGKDIQCDDGLVCKDNICAKESESKPEEKDPEAEDAKCDSDESCGKDMKCDAGTCKTVAHTGDACDEKVLCEESSCEEGKCRRYGPEGEECDETAKLCDPGLQCSKAGFCRKPVQLGEKCDDYDLVCDGSYVCSNDLVCIKKVGYGEDCGPEIHAECSGYDNPVCSEGKCRTITSGASCNEMNICPDDQLCFEGECLDKSECKEDKDCDADTYCCTEDGCKLKNTCIPYGKGPRPEVNDKCEYETVSGLFEAAIQCEWTSDAKAYPDHQNVLMTPLVMNTPHDSGQANEIIFTTYNCSDGGEPSGKGSSLDCNGVIRIINAETCALHESIFDDKNRVIGGSNLAMADVTGDGNPEIIASRGIAQPEGAAAGGGLVVFTWDDSAKHYKVLCNTKDHSGNLNWGGSALHDINNDGIAEIIGYGGEVFRAKDCARLNPGQTISELYYTPTLGDLDGDGKVEIIGTTNIYRWNNEANKWDTAYSNVRETGIHQAFADFGTPKEDGTFDFEHFDGIAETVGCGSNVVELSTLSGKKLMRVEGVSGGGPCTIGDFNGDKLPEIATAFGDQYRVFDPKCTKDSNGALPKGCARESVLWEKYSQDASSASTGSSLFDFDGDGAMEAVYADECYTRVYDGKTGDVLFSAFRSSATWHEYPVIADVDNDESAEIVVGSNNSMVCASPDPIHRGLRCKKDDDCKSKKCVGELCRCTGEGGDQCNSRTDMKGNILNEYKCVAPLPGDETGGNVCRAIRANETRVTGVRVMRDRLDRWTSSRSIWNQHAYSITNVNDDMTIPKTANWVQNFLSTKPTLNNFRQNVQGERGKNTAPDITGKLDKDNLCIKSGSGITLHGVVCNRGTKAVGSKLPASFYAVDKDGNLGEKFCTAYTSANVPIGKCLEVSCEITEVPGNIRIRMVTNDDGKGGHTTVECNPDNNTDEILLNGCKVN